VKDPLRYFKNCFKEASKEGREGERKGGREEGRERREGPISCLFTSSRDKSFVRHFGGRYFPGSVACLLIHFTYSILENF
jgi:hypothetical protein